MTTGAYKVGSVAHVLDFEPDLGAGIDGAEWDHARHACRGRVSVLPPGRCDLRTVPCDRRGPAAFIVVVEGLLVREMKLRDRHLIELLGPGDVVRPSPEPEGEALAAGPLTTALTRLTVLGLGATFLAGAARWPMVVNALLDRLEAHRRRLVVQELILHLPRAEHRILLMLWHLCARWGRVGAEGCHLPLRLTHDLLGQLVAARRSTVTLALRALERDGMLWRAEDGTWLVTAAGQEMVHLVARTDATPILGDTLLTRQQSDDLIRDARALLASASQIRAHHRRR